MSKLPAKAILSKAKSVAKKVAGQGDSKQAAMYRSMVNRERERVRELRAERDSLAKQLQQAKSGELLLDLVNAGQEFEPAFIEFVRQSHAFTNRMKTRAFTHALMEDEKHKSLGLIGFGVFLVNEELYESAHSYFEKAGTELALSLAPVEYYLAFFSVDANSATGSLINFLNSNRDKISRATHLELIKALVKYMKIDAVQAELPLLIAAESQDPELDEEGTKLVS